MNEKHILLLRYLLKQEDAVYAKQLAADLMLSLRTVKSYVKLLNTQQTVILSSNRGYRVVRALAIPLLDVSFATLPQTYLERVHYIIKKMLIHHEKLSVFDLCEQLFISYSTLKAELVTMNKTFSQYNISIITQHNMLFLRGSEQNKRRLTSAIIFAETSYNFIDLAVLERSFDKHTIIALEKIIKRLFNSSNYYLNDFSFMHILLHFLILIERVQNDKHLNEQEPIKIEHAHESQLIAQLCHAIEQQFSLKLNAFEISGISLLLKTNTNYHLASNAQKLKQIIRPGIFEMAEDIVHAIFSMYALNFNTDSFMLPFALHLDNLLLRITSGKLYKNPLLHTIRSECPIIYEIAIFISIKLSQNYQAVINEDEIAFLALHVGTEIERQKVNRTKLKCILLCPDYMGLETKIYNELLLNFNNDMTIIKIISQLKQMESLDADLLISTIDVPPTIYYDVFLLSPFNFSKQKRELYQKMEEARSKSKKKALVDYFECYFSAELFYRDVVFADKYQLIHEVGGKMEQLGIVGENFVANVCAREYAATTKFGQIAIPHSIYMDAPRTSIALLINPSGINWDEGSIAIVLLIAINNLDKSMFSSLYEGLVSIFDDKQMIEKITKARDFSAFKKIIYEQM
ncbi:transcriptional antiterminator [Erysipelotrichaceae bacterium]|nr:transcriptional antiterminator [Erysipelotrichaceae bacterium]